MHHGSDDRCCHEAQAMVAALLVKLYIGTVSLELRTSATVAAPPPSHPRMMTHVSLQLTVSRTSLACSMTAPCTCMRPQRMPCVLAQPCLHRPASGIAIDRMSTGVHGARDDVGKARPNLDATHSAFIRVLARRVLAQVQRSGACTKRAD
eukprot:jgi/Ulvmu1/9896/UM057_0053.1